jgi:hypothetical protein
MKVGPVVLNLCATLALLTGCASVQETGNVSQPVNTRLTAGVGDTVLRIATEKNLPNAFGRADIEQVYEEVT